MRHFLLCILLGVIFSASGCMTTAYKLVTDERSVGCYMDDVVITAKIRKSFVDDPVLSVFDIKVMVHKGRVVLAGVLETEDQCKRAVLLAQKVSGVPGVKNYFLLKRGHSLNGFADDCVITGKVKARLVGDKDLRAFQIEVYTICGHVVLAGIVNSEGRAKRAVWHARGVPGVHKVQSFITVEAGRGLI